MKKTIIRTAAVAAVAAAGMFGLAACGGGGDSAPAGSETTETEVVETEGSDGEESEAFITDLKDGVTIISEKVAEEPATTQIMLASDVEQPTQKYGMWVMPYYPSEAVDSYIMTVQVDGGKFHVEAVSKDSGKTWRMDQDGNVTEVTE